MCNEMKRDHRVCNDLVRLLQCLLRLSKHSKQSCNVYHKKKLPTFFLACIQSQVVQSLRSVNKVMLDTVP